MWERGNPEFNLSGGKPVFNMNPKVLPNIARPCSTIWDKRNGSSRPLVLAQLVPQRSEDPLLLVPLVRLRSEDTLLLVPLVPCPNLSHWLYHFYPVGAC